MKKVNFDALRQIKAPEELINRTLSAAAECDDAEKSPVIRMPIRRRRWAAAAGIILVLGVGLTSYFLFRNISNAPVLVAPSTDAVTEPDTTAAVPTAGTALPTGPDADDPTHAPTEPTTQRATEPPSERPTAPSTEAPTQPRTETPTQPATQPVTAPTEPTQPATDAPTQPDPLIVEPTVPIEPPSVSEPDPTEPWDNPTEPQEPGVDPSEPSGGPDNPTEAEWHPIRVHGSFSPDLLTGSGKVYCSIYNSQGMSMLPWDRFSSLREAWITYRDEDHVWVVYEIPFTVTINTDTYLVAFYNEDGVVVSSTKQIIEGYD